MSSGLMSSVNRRLAGHNRIVVKIGSALLVDRKSGLKQDWLKSLASDIAELRREGHEVLVVSSGAIAMGRTVLDMRSGSLKLEESQAAAAVGQEDACESQGWHACRRRRDCPRRQANKAQC